MLNGVLLSINLFETTEDTWHKLPRLRNCIWKDVKNFDKYFRISINIFHVQTYFDVDFKLLMYKASSIYLTLFVPGFMISLFNVPYVAAPNFELFVEIP